MNKPWQSSDKYIFSITCLLPIFHDTQWYIQGVNISAWCCQEENEIYFSILWENVFQFLKNESEWNGKQKRLSKEQEADINYILYHFIQMIFSSFE